MLLFRCPPFYEAMCLLQGKSSTAPAPLLLARHSGFFLGENPTQFQANRDMALARPESPLLTQGRVETEWIEKKKKTCLLHEAINVLYSLSKQSWVSVKIMQQSSWHDKYVIGQTICNTLENTKENNSLSMLFFFLRD